MAPVDTETHEVALLSIAQARAYLGGLSKSCFYQTAAREIPRYRISEQRVGYRRSDLDSYIESRVEAPLAPS